jgi:hypothetical protein
VYELHVRDFSASDGTVPENLRGKYLAFDPAATGSITDGQRHLKDLSSCGLTHIHLLPSYDFGSVPERPEDQRDVSIDLTQFAPGACLEPSSRFSHLYEGSGASGHRQNFYSCFHSIHLFRLFHSRTIAPCLQMLRRTQAASVLSTLTQDSKLLFVKVNSFCLKSVHTWPFWTADGQEQQAEVMKIASQDAFNWGYDPVHYGR